MLSKIDIVIKSIMTLFPDYRGSFCFYSTVVYGDHSAHLQSLEEQWNQLLCQWRVGVVWRNHLVCQHKWCKWFEKVLLSLCSGF